MGCRGFERVVCVIERKKPAKNLTGQAPMYSWPSIERQVIEAAAAINRKNGPNRGNIDRSNPARRRSPNQYPHKRAVTQLTN